RASQRAHVPPRRSSDLATLLALASALRYYFVITVGERVVADLRRDVFARVTSLSPAFFDVNQSGEIVSRLTADTTQIKSARLIEDRKSTRLNSSHVKIS